MTDQRAIAKIINDQWTNITSKCNKYQIRHLDAIRRCRTPSLGGHWYICNQCNATHKRYNSCRNRHCPVCQNTQKKQWIEAREKQLLPTKYFHLVFTLPHQLNELCLAYKRQLYQILFQTTWNTINTFAWNPKYLGAQIGATIVLHTWGSNLSFHPHLHCIIPAAGISYNNKWKQAKGKGKFLFPVKALSKVFRGKFCHDLKQFLHAQGMDNTSDLFQQLYAKPWVVYCKPPFGGAKGVIKYLARYTHKIAITNHRIVSHKKEKVRFRFTDYRHANQAKIMALESWEFVRRFTLHLLPKGFTRIRHFGILSSQYKALIFPLLQKSTTTSYTSWEDFWNKKGVDFSKCPYCKSGKLIASIKINPRRGPPRF